MAKKEIVREVNHTFDKEVYNEIKYYLSDAFSKYLILQTPCCVFWTKDGFKSKDLNKVLNHNGIKEEEAIFVESDSCWHASRFEKFIFEPNNKYFYMIQFYVNCMASKSDKLKVSIKQMLKIYPDKCFVYIRPSNFNPFPSLEGFISLNNNATVRLRDQIKTYVYNYGDSVCSDIDTKRVISPKSSAAYYKMVSDNTYEAFKRFFLENNVPEKCMDDLDKHVQSINTFLRKATKYNDNASNTRYNLVNNVFTPYYNKIKDWVKDKTIIKSKEYDAWLREHPSETNNYIRYKPFVVRDKEWLICVESMRTYGKIIFYNTETKRKYMAATNYSGDVNNYGVFNLENFDILPGGYCSDGFLNHYNYRSGYNLYFIIDDFEYIDSMKMYDINGNEILYTQCFENTPIINVVDSSKKYLFTEILNKCIRQAHTHSITGAISIDVSTHTIEKIINQNRIPIYYFLMLCLKDDYKLAAEQLAKGGYFGILKEMVSDQNAFVGNTSDASCWRSIILFDKNQTNLKSCFNMNSNQLKIIDRYLSKEDTPSLKIINYCSMLFGKDKVRSIDDQTFSSFLDYFKKQFLELSFFASLVNTLKNVHYDNILNNPKETLRVFEKVDNLSIWKDYLTMVAQLKQYVENNIVQIDMKKYKVVPDKSIRYVQLRPKPRPIYYVRYYDRGSMVDTDEQFDDLQRYYKNIEPVYDSNKTICGAILNMTIAEHVRFLHDELSSLITVYRDKEKDKLFGSAVKRVQKYEWENNEIKIIAPKQPSDIVNDASMLSHCAASFIDPIINGSENIMFIRRKDMADIPWFTMAIDNNGNIEQIHGYRNCQSSIIHQKQCFDSSLIPSYEKQIEFLPMLKKWAKEKGINVDSIKPTYGALCAKR